MKDFIKSFRNYYKKAFVSKETGKPTGTANSYAKAVEYLCLFLKISKIDLTAINKLQQVETDIKDINSKLYKDFYKFLTARNAISYLEKKFVSASFPKVYDFWESKISSRSEDYQILQLLSDDKIKTSFTKEKVSGCLPEPTAFEHDYTSKNSYGTVQTGIKKIYSGRKAEKYVMDFLSCLGFIDGVDFKDVSNKKEYGYDIEFLKNGYEIKNIKSGSFYLSDNEIGLLLLKQTSLILVDIDNGIWLLKNDSKWVEKTIKDIVAVREYAKSNFSRLDLSDIRISIKGIIADVVEISQFSKEQLIKVFQLDHC